MSAPLRSRARAAPIVTLLVLLAAAASPLAGDGRVEPPRGPGLPYYFRPTLAVSESLQPYLDEITPGSDLFPDERVAGEFIGMLAQFGERLKSGADRTRAADALLSPAFKGSRLQPGADEIVSRQRSLEIRRARAAPGAGSATLDARAFGRDLGRQLEDFRAIATAEFLVVAFEMQPDKAGAATDVRFDLVGPGRAAWRLQLNGTWRLRWRREASGWRVVEWIAGDYVRSVAPTPIFRDVTTAAFGGDEAFRRQLAIDFDTWAATIDSALARDSNGHHGVSVGDADGDGLDDVYVAQPYGMPDRLFRARGDGTYEDITARAGLGTLEDTQQALFGDVDNDGDQDLVLTTGAGPVLLVNEGGARFVARPGAFRVERRISGAPMSMAMADYDRDGHLDLYLCVYSFYYGAGEAKAGTPTPYYDAVNGPPNVLFRNDGQGGFVDVTREAGLDVNNDRYSFSAAWGDYDADGWPDLIVANDFGRKNLYRNRGLVDGKVAFEDVAARAGAEDHAAGMSVFWFDADADGRFDVYAGQMWSDNGLRITSSPAFMPEADARVRALYRHHANGNSLLRNEGDGTFEDVTTTARANMGRWSWSTGALDFDSDGWEDVYAVTGMVTRGSTREDLDWMFWGGVVARSPLTQATGTPYDDAWRAINRLMVERSVAGHQRNVVLRNDGRGAFDDVSGAVGLDLDEDGRAFAVTDVDGDGDADVMSLAPRSAPQLRVFRNDFASRGATLAVRLTGAGPGGSGSPGTQGSNRDAIGARVTVETDVMKRTKVVSAGSGFLSQHSKELLFGLGASQRLVRLTVEWPGGRSQEFTNVALNQRVRVHEGGEIEAEPFSPFAPLPADEPLRERPAPPPSTWLYEPFPASDFALPDLRGQERTLAALRGRPAVVLVWASEAPPSRAALVDLDRAHRALADAGIGSLALSLDRPGDLANVRTAAAGVASVPVVVASESVALGWSILHRHLFIGRPDLQLPTTFLLDAGGRVVRVYRGRFDADQILRDALAIEATPDDRLARGRPFPGVSATMPGRRDTVPYGRDLLDQGLEAQAVVAFEQAAQGNPTASVLFRLGSLLAKKGETARATVAYERALALQPDLAEASNDLGTLLAQAGNVPAAIERFQAALAAAPDYPDALNNLGYALLLSGREAEAITLYEKALALQPDFPEALNNLGLIRGRRGDLEAAEALFRKALEKRARYGEAANNLAIVLVSRGRGDEAVRVLTAYIDANADYESAYVTLAKIHLAAGRREDGLAVVERLLRRNPDHAVAKELQRQFR
jgi:tetratricopeptide (TPR) repeat protein